MTERRTEKGIKNRRLHFAARQRALTRLARKHPEEFAELLADEKQKGGFTPLPMGAPR